MTDNFIHIRQPKDYAEAATDALKRQVDAEIMQEHEASSEFGTSALPRSWLHREYNRLLFEQLCRANAAMTSPLRRKPPTLRERARSKWNDLRERLALWIAPWLDE